MTNEPKDNLFVLVKSLTKSEKRQFTLYVGRMDSNEDSKFLNLFQLLDKINRYDEISEEWELNTPSKMTKDELIMKILQDERYQIPKRLPSF